MRSRRIQWTGVLAAAILFAHPAAAADVRIAPASPRQGDPVVIAVTPPAGATDVTGALGDRPLSFFKTGDGYSALGGVDVEARPGALAWRVRWTDARGASARRSGTIAVRTRDFPVERLTLPRGQVELDPETERRATDEAAQLRAVYRATTPERLWRGAFARPIAGEGPGQGFGARRILNGLPRMPHAGVDYAADTGTPVLAANRGRVGLVGDFFFPGRFVVLDHGLGLYTLYFHLDRVDVAAGALVEKGDPVGTVGATGRATGPHLHWGAQLNQVRVDPSALLSLPVGE